MIEIVSAARCVTCDLCIAVCPMNVFDRAADGLPVIARQSDCQTCFLCEAHCPTDALYVAAERRPLSPDQRPTEAEVVQAGLFGSYRARLGWGKGRKPPRNHDDALALSHDAGAAPAMAVTRQPVPAHLPKDASHV